MRRSSIGARLIWMTIGAILTLTPLLAASPAHVAQAAGPVCVPNGAKTVCTFSYTGVVQTWTVPNNVSAVQFDVYGAAGGNVMTEDDGGKGGRATATFPVTAGEWIVLMVGGVGDTVIGPEGLACGDHIPQGGFNGGGNGGAATCPGAGGGGASDVRIGGTALADRVLVAGGGGGAVNIIVNLTGIRFGGKGGGLTGSVGGPDVSEWLSVRGQGGNQDCTTGSGQYGIGTDGASNDVRGSGGGGGGYCGGSGGQTDPDGYGTGGGGGSGYGPEGTAFETGVREGDGQIIITFDTPDDTAPTTTASYSNNYIPGTWSNQPVTVTLSATDNAGGSGVATTYYAINNPACNTTDLTACSIYTTPITISNGGTATLTFFSTDASGNIETPQTVFIAVDSDDPVANPTIEGTLGTNGWYISPVTVTWHWDDALSGISPANCPATSTADTDGERNVSATCTDMAGNSATASTLVKIDQTLPSVTYTGNAGTYGVDQQIAITCTAADNASGIATTTCEDISGPAWSFGLGTHNYSATATDNAGHSSSGSTTFSVGVSYDSLANLTCQFVTQPMLCNTMRYYLASAEWAEGRHVSRLTTRYLDLYATMVTSLRGRELTTMEAQTLLDLAQALSPPVRSGR